MQSFRVLKLNYKEIKSCWLASQGEAIGDHQEL